MMRAEDMGRRRAGVGPAKVCSVWAESASGSGYACAGTVMAGRCRLLVVDMASLVESPRVDCALTCQLLCPGANSAAVRPSPRESLDSFAGVKLEIAGGVLVDSWPVPPRLVSINRSSQDGLKLDRLDTTAGLQAGFLARTFVGGFAVEGKSASGFGLSLS